MHANMNEAFRKTGIDAVKDVSWGSHFCLFYQTEAEVLEVMLPYFKAGLENNEFCLWITPPSLRHEEALGAMQKAVPNFSQYLAKGQMEVLPHKEWYLKEGQFDPNRIVKGWMARLNEALDRGHKGLRAASGYARGKNEWGQVIGYEKEMNGVISMHPMIAMCA